LRCAAPRRRPRARRGCGSGGRRRVDDEDL
jgi:hypothetical protein